MVLVSDKNTDDLLAQLQAEFEPNRESEKNLRQPPRSAAPSKSMDKMLDELRAELESGRGRPNSKQNSATPAKSNREAVQEERQYRERLKILIDQDYQMQARKREAKFAEIKRQEEARIAEQKRRQQELVEAQRREELRERRRKEAMREKAKQWLKNLNLSSEEGKWFEEFSYSYEDKLQAAIDYLEAMRESGL